MTRLPRRLKKRIRKILRTEWKSRRNKEMWHSLWEWYFTLKGARNAW